MIVNNKMISLKSTNPFGTTIKQYNTSKPKYRVTYILETLVTVCLFFGWPKKISLKQKATIDLTIAHLQAVIAALHNDLVQKH